MVKSSYNTKVKAESRRRWMRFLRHHVKDRNKVRVICFPGPEALEIFEVYDKIDIPRRNITCIERDEETYQLIKALNLGCSLVHADLSNFISTNKGNRFDIISLDFTGQFGSFGSDIQSMVKSKMLSDTCYFFTNFCAAREKDLTKAFYIKYATQLKSVSKSESLMEDLKEKLGTRNDKSVEYVSNKTEAYSVVNRKLLTNNQQDLSIQLPSGQITFHDDGYLLHETLGQLDSSFADAISDKLRNLRDQAIWHGLREMLISGVDNPLHSIAYNQFNGKEMNRIIEDGLSLNLTEKAGFLPPEYIKAIKDISVANEKNGETHNDILKQRLEYIIIATLRDLYCRNFAFIEESQSFVAEGPNWVVSISDHVATQLLLMAVSELLSEAHFVQESKSMKYVSENGMPMYCDLFQLKRTKRFNFLEEIIDRKATTIDDFFSRIETLSPLEIMQLAKRIDDNWWNFISEAYRRIPTRLDLGRESQSAQNIVKIAPPSPEPVPEPLTVAETDYLRIKKAEAIELKRAMPGLTSREIGEALFVNPRTVAAWLAHLTMGTYNPKS